MIATLLLSTVLLACPARSAAPVPHPEVTDEKAEVADERPKPLDARTAQLGRTHTELFYGGRADELWERFDAAMRKGVGSRDALGAFREQVADELGRETAVVAERTSRSGALRVYTRLARFEKLDRPVRIEWSFGAEDRISGFYIRPQPTEAPTKYLEYRTKTALRLPFDGAWDVFWGGRSVAENYHAATVDQRFAYDILIVVDGSTHTGDGKRNEDYHCFGRPLRAPGAGVVVAVENGVEDNVPGEMNPRQALGNHVILDHGNGEFSFLAHFQRGTVEVAPGQRVEPGTLLGKCGNSGNSSEPHLHYHLQTTPDFNRGEGLPAQFLDYAVASDHVERGEPTKGQRVRHR